MNFYGAHVKAVCCCDAYGYNLIHLSESSSASGNWQDVVKVCRAGLRRALCPESHLEAVHICGFWGLPSLALQSAVSLRGCNVESGLPMLWFLGLSLCQSGHLCKQPALSV